MNAPETLNDTEKPSAPEPLSAIQTITLGQLRPSPTNPRTRFDQVKLNELAESMKVQGVLQPLLVREITTPSAWPFPSQENELPRYEIIAGERRYRAATIAELFEVPCFIRNLTDLQVLHAQVIENLHRDDLHPLEEADGYQRMMTDFGSTAEGLAAEIGKSKAYIYGRLKLCALVDETRTAFFDGLLVASTALLIARIPVAKQQIQATKVITEKSWDGEVMSYRRAREIIQREFMLDLDQAPFSPKDSELLPKAGSCTDCPKRTGNQAGLFDDVKSKDVCTDTVCFGMKKAAYVLRLQNDAAQTGDTFVKAKDAKKLLPEKYTSAHYQLPKAGLTPLDSHIPNDPKGRTWEQALKKQKLLDAKNGEPAKVTKTLIEDPHHEGEVIQAVNIADAAKALREAGYEVSLRGSQTTKTNKGESAKAKLQMAVEKAYRERLFNTLHQQIEADLTGPAPKVQPEISLLLADDMFSRLYDPKLKACIARQHVGETLANNDAYIEAFEKMLPAMTMPQHFMVMVDCLLVSESFPMQHAVQNKAEPETMLRIASAQGIDAATIKQEVATEIEAAQKKPTSAPKKSAAKTKPKGGAA